ncbi:MAG: tRNA preQ1(34) S-adenosylmethionine ribosyltransferase-isomerase QueA, partial [Pseudomonadota bacterium]|nr:tRNA preQ1(34) S-adenosylmethionine ribosyltransferase-isomerase QueA [Pseudomonadota bacterium]
IADAPVEPRRQARLLDQTGAVFTDRRVGDLPGLLRAGDILVFNDTKVLPARLVGRRGAAKVEVTLHKSFGQGQWLAFARPGRRLRVGDEVTFTEDLSAEVRAKDPRGDVTLDFGRPESDLRTLLWRHGSMPLPPYIKRETPRGRDFDDYQTIFAAREGAVAAPTAGLHFTEDLLADLAAAGVATVAITLHVGAGTFLPVKVTDADDHVMHSEWGEVSAATVARIAAAKAAGGRVVAVGTTSLRILESAARDGRLAPFSGDTDLFITPGFQFHAVDLLLTNFHLPRSTLLMLVAAFHGRARMLAAYDHAKAAGYRFYSYGDCCLLDRRGDD